MPDIFVAADTTQYSDYYRNLVRRGVLNSYVLEYYDRNRARINNEFRTFDDFRAGFNLSEEEIKDLVSAGEKAGVKYDEAQYKTSETEILMVLKALIASNIWQLNEYYRIINEKDNVVNKALEIISDRNAYNRILGFRQ